MIAFYNREFEWKILFKRSFLNLQNQVFDKINLFENCGDFSLNL